jgi:uncharacterized cupin superfamily protein
VARLSVPEAPFEPTEGGLIPAGEGWFVLNAKNARWFESGHGGRLTFFEGRAEPWPLGMNVSVLEPGEPMGMYHYENVQEDFLVVSGEPLLIVEGEERRLKPWDLVHCPPRTNHIIVGAGDGPSVVVAVGARGGTADWGAYTVDEAAQRLGVGLDAETTDAGVAYASFPPNRPVSYEDGWLP